jgi:hypothetical protein
MSRHKIIALQADSSYIIEGRLCPVRRTPLQPGEYAVVCQQHSGEKEIVSLEGLSSIAGRCPFCDRFVDIPLHDKPPSPIDQLPRQNQGTLSAPSQRGFRVGRLVIPAAIALFLIICLAPLGLFMFYRAMNSSYGDSGNLSNPIQATWGTIRPTSHSGTPPARTPAPTSTQQLPTASGQTTTDSCPGAPTQRVRVGDKARVCTQYDRLIVRSQPGRGGREITRLEPGAYVEIIEGPICANRYSWWRIRSDSGTLGWVAEGGDNVDPYFICPTR